MPTRKAVEERRAKVVQMLSKSVTSIKEIAYALKLDYQVVQNDIEHIKKETAPWLFGLAGEGYAFDCRMGIQKMLNLEMRLEQMLQDASEEKADSDKIIKIINALRDTVVVRLSVEGEGPTLLAIRKIKRGDFDDMESK